MREKHYVIQWKFGTGAKWMTLPQEYPTLEEAQSIMQKKQKAGLASESWRIAESYVVIRYKPVKT